jgi:hypothetical protein
LLEGKNVNLRVVENEDLPLVAEWENNLGFIGEYNPLRQLSKGEIEKNYDKLGSEEKWFFIEKKDGRRVGFIEHISVRAAGRQAMFWFQVKEAKVTVQKLSNSWWTTCFCPRTLLGFRQEPM